MNSQVKRYVYRARFGRAPNRGASVPVEFGAWHVEGPNLEAL